MSRAFAEYEAFDEVELAELADVLAGELPATDVALANIDLASVEALSPRLEARVLVTAGYFHSRRPKLPGFAHRERRIDGGWAADLFERQ